MPVAPRAWPPAVRAALVSLAAVAAFVAVLAAKRAFLPAYLAAEPWSGLLALAFLAGAVEGARRLLRAPPPAAWSLGVPLLAVLVVLVLSTPLPYEVAAQAERLPHPEGTARPTVVETAPHFERRHPVATAVFRYAPDRGLADLTSETRQAFEAERWSVSSVRMPAGGAEGEFGFVAARKGPFTVQCTIGQRGGWSDWDGTMATVGCRMAV